MKKTSQGETSTFRASITGIDGAGKDTVTKLALQGLSYKGLRVVKLGRPAYRFCGGEAEQIYARTTGALDSMHQLADGKRSPRLITAVNAVNVVAQSRLLERAATHDATDMVVSSRDPRVDPAVYYSYYAKNMAHRISMADRIAIMQRITGSMRNLIVRLIVDPEQAVERIEGRMKIEEALRASTGANAGMRDKWRHMHENARDLAMLDKNYGSALTALQEAQPTTTVIEIDTTNRPREEVVDLTQIALEATFRGIIPKGERMMVASRDALPYLSNATRPIST